MRRVRVERRGLGEEFGSSEEGLVMVERGGSVFLQKMIPFLAAPVVSLFLCSRRGGVARVRKT